MTRGALLLLALALVFGAFLRFDGLGEPSYWLDEILGDTLTTSATAQPLSHWITGLDREHGPFYYASQLASRAIGRDEFAGRLPAALVGLATIPLVWLAARRNFAAAFLIALSPLHVYYSREARPYALLMLLTAALIVALLEDAKPAIVAAILVALLYTSATAAPVILAATFVTLFINRRLFAVAAIATLFIPLLYRGKPWIAAPHLFPSLDLAFARTVLHALTVSAFGDAIRGRTALALLVLAIVGALAMLRRDRRAALIVIAMTILPALFAIIALWHSGHFFATRYIAPSLIGFIILAGTGMTSLRRPPPAAVALLLTILIATQTWDTARREPFRKLDWRLIASTLRERVKPGDVIATAESYSYVSLRYYLRDLPPSVHYVRLDLIPVAEKYARTAPAMWLVTAGASSPTADWMCRYPLLLASPLEGFRLHYAPSARAFLADRSSVHEQRVVASALGERGFALEMGSNDDLVLGDGWASSEGTFRWAIGRHATLTFPRTTPRDRVIRFRAYPLTHASLPAQTVRVVLNGSTIATLALAPEWSDYVVRAPSTHWRDGINTLTFDFARATSPASLDPNANDARELAASFDRIAIDDVGAKPGEAREVLAIRIATDRFLDARAAWRHTPTRFPAAQLRRASVEALLVRLGFDPRITWPQLARGDVRLDDVAETVAYGSVCEDDAAFVRRAFTILLGRPPDTAEAISLLGISRVRAVGRMVKSDEFRKAILISGLRERE